MSSHLFCEVSSQYSYLSLLQGKKIEIIIINENNFFLTCLSCPWSRNYRDAFYAVQKEKEQDYKEHLEAIIGGL